LNQNQQCQREYVHEPGPHEHDLLFARPLHRKPCEERHEHAANAACGRAEPNYRA
jgi:hypothetical protein